MNVVMNDGDTIPKHYLSDICKIVRLVFNIVKDVTMLLQFLTLDLNQFWTVGFSLLSEVVCPRGKGQPLCMKSKETPTYVGVSLLAESPS